uniref:Uncharacterized protein n=1 Tax=Anguilla anguilla TaxID=7936 RepID=A0A0E9QFM8_ANGAN
MCSKQISNVQFGEVLGKPLKNVTAFSYLHNFLILFFVSELL